MTDIYLVNNLLFVGPCLLLLYLAFRDQIKRPRLPVVAAAAVLYLFITLIAGGIYLKTDTSVEKTVISAASQLAGVFIFSAASNYTFGQSLFIITVVKNYSENVRLYGHRQTAQGAGGRNFIYYARPFAVPVSAAVPAL